MCEGKRFPVEGMLVITPPVICKTCAYYVGMWCGEYDNGQWVYQPYDRLTEYLRDEYEAAQELHAIQMFCHSDWSTEVPKGHEPEDTGHDNWKTERL
jgi:hypothetical protein